MEKQILASLFGQLHVGNYELNVMVAQLSAKLQATEEENADLKRQLAEAKPDEADGKPGAGAEPVSPPDAASAKRVRAAG